MKKLLIGLGGLVAVLVVGVLVVPGLIDWNNYKTEITEQAKAFTGRDLVINGDIKLTILPAPALIVGDVHLANMEGASATDMVSLKSLEVRIAFGPLLTGQVQVKTVRLVEPVIELERMADGRANWQFEAEQPDAAAAMDTQENAGAGDAPDIRLDSFIIEKGTLIFRDVAAGTTERVESINASIAAASINGPFESDGNVTVRGIPLGFGVTIGKIIESRTATLDLRINLRPGASQIIATGAVTELESAPKFKGKVSAKGESLSELLAGAGVSEMSGLLAQEFSVAAEATASATSADLSDLSVNLGAIALAGAASLDLDPMLAINVDLTATSIDLDKLLAAVTHVSAPAAAGGESTAAGMVGNAPTAAAVDGALFPQNINVAVNLAAESVSYRGGLIRQARLSTELVNGEITLNQLSAQLPGSTDVALFGFVVPEKGQPLFDGGLEVSIGDLHGVLGWLDLPPLPVPPDRLRKMTLASTIQATPTRIGFNKVDMQFDSSRLTGTASASLGTNTSIDMDLKLDRINLDAYLLGQAEKKKAADSPGASDADNPLAGIMGAQNAIKGLAVNLKAQIKKLVYGGNSIANIQIDTDLANNALNINNIAIADLVGSTVKAKGQINGLDGIPGFKNLRLDATIKDLARVFRLAGVEPPANAKAMGSVNIAGQIDGTALKPNIDIRLSGAGASIASTGSLSFLPIGSGYAGTLQVKHPSMIKLMAALGVAYRPVGNLGGLTLNTSLQADTKGIVMKGLSGSVGPLAISGDGALALDGPRPRIVADLQTGDLAIDGFLPAAQGAALASPAGPVPAAFTVPRVGQPDFRRLVAMATGHWPTDPIDLMALKSADADIRIKSSAIIYDKYRIDNADLMAKLDAGVLTVKSFRGTLFGGTLDANAVVTASTPPSVQTSVAVKDADVGRALVAVTGEKLAKGMAAMTVKLGATGFSVSDMIANLAGNGSVALSSLDVKSGAKGTAMSAALGLVAGLNDLGSVLSGKKSGAGLADISGSFTIDKGIGRSSDLKLTSSIGNGQASGAVDLPRWLIDIGGDVRMSQNFLGQILGQGSAEQILPFTIKGVLDAPNVKLDTSRLQSAGLPIPGLENVLKKKGVGQLLDQLLPGLGGAATTTPQPAPSQPSGGSEPPPPPSSQQQPQKIKPQDLLKGLLKGLGN
ncbi:MAG: AsmA family protein [Rhodospirillaceae bacterium]|nr:AsmA family protein [Rhodospirillaceae bacterium]